MNVPSAARSRRSIALQHASLSSGANFSGLSAVRIVKDVVLLHQVCGCSASWWQSMDGSSASTPVLAVKSKASAPPDFRDGAAAAALGGQTWTSRRLTNARLLP